MKFCVVGPTYPFKGGISHFATMLVEQLRVRHEVDFISFRRQCPRWLFPGNAMRDLMDDPALMARLRNVIQPVITIAEHLQRVEKTYLQVLQEERA